MSDGIVAYGSFSHSFEMNIFDDRKFSNIMNFKDVLIGQMLYAEVTWSATNLYSKMRFFVHDCQVEIGDTALEIVKENCYSAAVSASLISPGHLQRKRSRFQFKSFSAGILSYFIKSVTELFLLI